MKKATLKFGKHFLVTAVIMSLCFILFDLWDPFKQLVTGNYESGTSLASYISISKNIPVIIAVSVVMAGADTRRKKAGNK